MKKIITTLALVTALFAVTAGTASASTAHDEALDAAKSYLSSGHFSRAGLIEQLESPYGEDFSHRMPSGPSTTSMPTGMPRRSRPPSRI